MCGDKSKTCQAIGGIVTTLKEFVHENSNTEFAGKLVEISKDIADVILVNEEESKAARDESTRLRTIALAKVSNTLLKMFLNQGETIESVQQKTKECINALIDVSPDCDK